MRASVLIRFDWKKHWIQLRGFSSNGWIWKRKKKQKWIFQFCCSHSNAVHRMRPIWISLHFSFRFYNCFHIKKNIYIYRYLSIEYFLRFFVSYLTRNNLKRLISCINITSIIFSFPPPITIRSNDFRQKCASSCGAKWTKPLAWATGHRAPMERNAARKRFVFLHLSIC